MQGYSIDEEDPKAYVMRISYARPPQAGPGSQRAPPHVRRDAGPHRRPPQHEQRKDANPRDSHPHPRDANHRHAGGRGPSPSEFPLHAFDPLLRSPHRSRCLHICAGMWEPPAVPRSTRRAESRAQGMRIPSLGLQNTAMQAVAVLAQVIVCIWL